MITLFLRSIVWVIVHMMYRTKSHRLENIPQEGACVLVCNHVSYVDALIIGAAVHRPVRFVMYYKIFQMPIIGLIFKAAKAIPIAGRNEDANLMEQAFAEVKKTLEDGGVVCIFPEGKLTTDGKLNVFKPGIERIVAETPVPVVPLSLRGLWGSYFSRIEGRPMKHPFRRTPLSRIDLIAGEPILASQVTAKSLEDKVIGLMP